LEHKLINQLIKRTLFSIFIWEERKKERRVKSDYPFISNNKKQR